MSRSQRKGLLKNRRSNIVTIPQWKAHHPIQDEDRTDENLVLISEIVLFLKLLLITQPLVWNGGKAATTYGGTVRLDVETTAFSCTFTILLSQDVMQLPMGFMREIVESV
jgi:hypothetical protein